MDSAARIARFTMFALVGAVGLHAVEPPAPAGGPEAWVLRSFRLPEEVWSFTDRDDLKPVPLPDKRTPEPDMMAHTRVVTAQLREFFRGEGVWLPTGTMLLLDRKAATLAVYTTPQGVEMLKSWCRDALKCVPIDLVLTLEFMQSDGPVMRDILRETAEQGENSAAWRRLEELATKGQAKHAGILQVNTRSGHKVNVTIGHHHAITYAFVRDAATQLKEERTSQVTGTILEVDPAISPDGELVDLNFALHHHYAPPTERKVPAGMTATLGAVEVPVTDFHSVGITSCTTMRNGQTVLLGMWRPEGSPEFDSKDVLQAVFLKADCVRPLPDENGWLLSKLEALSKTAPPPPVGASREPQGGPPGMETRRFRLREGSFSFANRPAPIDPFAVTAPKGQGRDKNVGAVQATLESYGISFPAGAGALFSPITRTLVVTGPPETLEQVDAMLSKMAVWGVPQVLVQTFHIVEGEAALIRSLVQSAATRADHGQEWRKIEELAAQGKVRVLSSLRFPTRSGQRTTMECGATHSYIQNSRRNSRDELAGEIDSSLVGTKLETDSVMTQDGINIDTNLSFSFDHAPPSLRVPVPASAGVRPHFEAAPPTDFHRATFKTAATFTSGRTKLLSTWKPEGGKKDGPEMLQAAFLFTTVVQVQP